MQSATSTACTAGCDTISRCRRSGRWRRTSTRCSVPGGRGRGRCSSPRLGKRVVDHGLDTSEHRGAACKRSTSEARVFTPASGKRVGGDRSVGQEARCSIATGFGLRQQCGFGDGGVETGRAEHGPGDGVIGEAMLAGGAVEHAVRGEPRPPVLSKVKTSVFTGGGYVGANPVA